MCNLEASMQTGTQKASSKRMLRDSSLKVRKISQQHFVPGAYQETAATLYYYVGSKPKV